MMTQALIPGALGLLVMDLASCPWKFLSSSVILGISPRSRKDLRTTQTRRRIPIFPEVILKLPLTIWA